MNVTEGDIFITKLERDFFGAFRILKTNGKTTFTEDEECILVGVTTYIGTEKPKLTNTKLTEILVQKRFFFNDKVAIEIRLPKGIEHFEYLGNIPLLPHEKKYFIKIGDGTNGCYPFSGVFAKDFGGTAFYEWRWEHEKEAFQQEVENEKRAREKRAEADRKRNMKPKKMMEETAFWEIIKKIDWTKNDDDERMFSAISFLATQKVTDIKQFQENLSYKLYQLDTKAHAKNIGDNAFGTDYFSEDYFLYVRCCVIANGKEIFQNALANPKHMLKNIDFEPLLYLASSAYEMKKKKDFDYETGCDYETYSNYTGWE